MASRGITAHLIYPSVPWDRFTLPLFHSVNKLFQPSFCSFSCFIAIALALHQVLSAILSSLACVYDSQQSHARRKPMSLEKQLPFGSLSSFALQLQGSMIDWTELVLEWQYEIESAQISGYRKIKAVLQVPKQKKSTWMHQRQLMWVAFIQG